MGALAVPPQIRSLSMGRGCVHCPVVSLNNDDSDGVGDGNGSENGMMLPLSVASGELALLYFFN